MPHSYKIPHKFCSGGDFTDYYGTCSHERDLLPDAILCTDLIIRDCHEREGYVGAGQVLASIRQKFWILRGHAAVRRVIGKCLKCRLWKAKPCGQIMAPLPSARVTPCVPPFSSIGVDYFSPMLVKSRRSQVKRYGFVLPV